MLIAGMFGRFLTRIYVKTAFLHASLDGQEEGYVRPPPLLWRWGFAEKGFFGDSRRLSKGFVQLKDSGISRETLSLLHWSCVSKGENTS